MVSVGIVQGDGLSTDVNIDVVCEIAKMGEDTAISMEDLGVHMIIKDDKTYIIMHEMEMVVVSSSTAGNELDNFIPPISDLKFIETGSGMLFERDLSYEAYASLSNADTITRLYMDGAELAGIQQLSNNQVTKTVEFVELSQNVPSRMFEIPKNYNIVEQ